MTKQQLIEEWRPVREFEDTYMVSNLGRVKRLVRDELIPNKHGGFTHRIISERYIKPLKTKNGYYVVNLTHKLKKARRLVHRLVAEAFIPNANGLPEINHIDCCKENNNAENLEWVTRSENLKLAYSTGCRDLAKNKRNGQLLREQLKRAVICERDGVEIRYAAIADAERDGFLHGAIVRCCQGTLKKHHGCSWRYADER